MEASWCRESFGNPACECKQGGWSCGQQPPFDVLVCIEGGAPCMPSGSVGLYEKLIEEFEATCPVAMGEPEVATDSAGVSHCCYRVATEACVGRPLRVGEGRVEAPLVSGVMWG